MGELIFLPKRCAYLGCRKPIRTDKGEVSVVIGDKHWHSDCYAKTDPDPTDGGEPMAGLIRIAEISDSPITEFLKKAA